jgi:hypothetical protein
MRKTIAALCCLAALTVAEAINAQQAFSLDLPQLVGDAPAYGSSTQISFDFEREFSHVERAVLVLRVAGTPARTRSCPGSFVIDSKPGPCGDRVKTIDLVATLVGAPTGVSTHALIEGLRSHPRELAGVFQISFGSYHFDHLRDGAGVLELSWNLLLSSPGLELLEPPAATISGAQILIEATPRAAAAPAIR